MSSFFKLKQPLTSFVNGRFVKSTTSLELSSSSSSSSSSSLLNPLFQASTGQIRGHWETATPAVLDEALSAARDAQIRWYREFSPMDRANVLRRAATLLQERQHDYEQDDDNIITLAESLDTGRPVMETQYEASGAADCLNWFAGLAPSVGGQHLDLASAGTANANGAAGSFGYTRREPLGLTVGIGAWNYPLQSAVWKSAPALAFGNSMVMKPSELTPTTALILAGIYQEAGLPDGVFSVVLGNGADVGQTIVNDPRVRKVSFTGSVATGKSIYTAAAQDLKKVTLELGGKSPLVIFDDCPLERAVTAAMMANWMSSGQVCSNGTRVFVQRAIYDEFLEQLVERTKALKIGDPQQEETQIGPMVSEGHMNKVLNYIDLGVREDGATLLYGGKRIGKEGYFLEPAIFVDCQDEMRIVREEIFGMVLCVLPFDTEEEVLERANDTSFGLSAGVFTNNLQRAHRMVAQLEAGTTWINNYNLAPVELPWGGFKSSGIGSENGLAGVESWTRMKSVYVEMGEMESSY